MLLKPSILKEEVFGWYHLPPHLSDVSIGGAMSNNFCNFPKLTIKHSYPLHVVIGQVCGSHDLSFSQCLFFSFVTQLYVELFVFTTHDVFQDTLSENVPIFKQLLRLFSLWRPAFHSSSSVAIQNLSKHNCFLTQSDNTSYDLDFFLHNPIL